MVSFTFVLPYDINRWMNVIVSTFLFFFNAIGLPSYPSVYDKYLLIVGLVFNVATIWFAWT